MIDSINARLTRQIKRSSNAIRLIHRIPPRIVIEGDRIAKRDRSVSRNRGTSKYARINWRDNRRRRRTIVRDWPNAAPPHPNRPIRLARFSENRGVVQFATDHPRGPRRGFRVFLAFSCAIRRKDRLRSGPFPPPPRPVSRDRECSAVNDRRRVTAKVTAKIGRRVAKIESENGAAISRHRDAADRRRFRE